MALAIIITIFAGVGGIDYAPNDAHDRAGSGVTGIVMIAVAMVIGAVIGLWKAKRVAMTGMPELIALLHSFVGLAAVLVGYNVPLRGRCSASPRRDVRGFRSRPTWRGRSARSTAARCSSASSSAPSPSPARSSPTSSCRAKMKSAPLMLPAHNLLNLGAIVVFFVLTAVLHQEPEPARCSSS